MAAHLPSPKVPAYVCSFPHPGLFIPQNITRGHTEISPELENVYAEIFLSVYKAGGTKKEVQEKAAERLRERAIIPYDSHVEKAHLCDREIHEECWQALSKFIPKPAKEMTEADWYEAIRIVSHMDRAKETLCTEEGFRTSNVFVFRNNLARVMLDVPKAIPILEKDYPDDIPTYVNILGKIHKLSSAELTLSRNPLTHAYMAGLLTAEEINFVDKHLYMAPSHTRVPEEVAKFVNTLLKMVQEERDPFDIAAFVHMKMAIIHPFNDGNGRASRALMNLILIQLGFEPVVFISRAEYSKAVWVANEHVIDFSPLARLLKSKTEIIKEMKAREPECSIEQKVSNLFFAYCNAKKLQRAWEKIPLSIRRELVTQLFRSKA